MCNNKANKKENKVIFKTFSLLNFFLIKKNENNVKQINK